MAQTPVGKGSKAGRDPLDQGPFLMSPGGNFRAVTNPDKSAASSSLSEEGNEVPSMEKLHLSDTSLDQSSMRGLFGGAISVLLPNSFEDVSLIRQVPDHQEVYVDRASEMSFIVEVLTFEESIPDTNAAHHFFKDLGECNEAKDVVVVSAEVVRDSAFMPKVRSTFSRCALVGRQTVAKFERKADAVFDVVNIFLVVVRLPTVGTDLLITLNAPHDASNPGTIDGIGAIDLVKRIGMESAGGGAPVAVRILQEALASFSIDDWSLFA